MILPFRGNFLLTQKFGVNKANYIQFGMQGHNGLDYGLPMKTQVIAPHNGTIIEAASDPTGYGNYLKIENDKEGSVLGHFDSFQVMVGDMVSEGQPIGLSGNTGNSTGPHIHWGYYLFPRNRQNGFAGFIDQLSLINQEIPVEDTLPIPNPGYAPTFEGQTVSTGGITYQSYKDGSGNLLWKIEQQSDWKVKYETLKIENESLARTIQRLNDQIALCNSECQKADTVKKQKIIDYINSL